MNNRKRIGDRTEPRGIPLLIGLEEESTAVAIDWSERKLKIEVQREEYKM